MTNLLFWPGEVIQMSDAVDDRTYLVVINDEDQYSIWLADRQPPSGWAAVGVEGSRDTCLDHIEKVWTDMRPRSLREALAGAHELPREDEESIS